MEQREQEKKELRYALNRQEGEGVLMWLRMSLRKKCERMNIGKAQREKKLLALRDIIFEDIRNQEMRKSKVKEKHLIALIEEGENRTISAALHIAAEEGIKEDDFVDFMQGISQKREYDN